MPYEYEALGYENRAGDRVEGRPSDINDTFSVFVHAWDPDNPEDQRHFWAHIPGITEGWNWDSWDAYIQALIDYGTGQPT